MSEYIQRTRIKICGMTRAEDIKVAVQLGVDALGFVFYSGSARYVQPSQARDLITCVPPFVSTVGLFVNATLEFIDTVLEQTPLTYLQLHGDETPETCALLKKRYGLPVIRALRVKAGIDLSVSAQQFIKQAGCHALLLDTWSEGYGGSGKTFDWGLLTPDLSENPAYPMILSGGLHAGNVAEAITKLHPYAVDISSGVEHLDAAGMNSKGIKDAGRMREFVEAVRAVDLS